jgi:SAM-dependent methyltransferase
LDATTSRFDRRASTYQDSALQQFLFGPAQKTALQLALELVPQARRILDVGCGTGQEDVPHAVEFRGGGPV